MYISSVPFSKELLLSHQTSFGTDPGTLRISVVFEDIQILKIAINSLRQHYSPYLVSFLLDPLVDPL